MIMNLDSLVQQVTEERDDVLSTFIVPFQIIILSSKLGNVAKIAIPPTQFL